MHHPTNLKHSDLATELLLNNPMLGEKIWRNCKVAAHESSALLCEVLRFLNLVAYTNKTLTPSHQVDLAWHEFILFTRSYDAFCTEHFGRYLHHQPSDDQKENQDQFLTTKNYYRAFFGTPPSPYWGHSDTAPRLSECGPCETIQTK